MKDTGTTSLSDLHLAAQPDKAERRVLPTMDLKNVAHVAALAHIAVHVATNSIAATPIATLSAKGSSAKTSAGPELEKEMSKTFLPTSTMLSEFDD
ncbi:hypothetical protein V6N13_068292 [Hibiscus sabdariffa]